jgi:hypothetical protein
MTHETHRRFLILPLIVIIGCLGSFPIAEHFLVTSKLQTPTTVAITYQEGQCTSSEISATSVSATPTATATQSATATPAATQSASATALPSTLTKVWAETGNTSEDYTNAQACAAAFVNTYETYSYQHMDSTTAALPMLSADAKKRFAEGYEQTAPNLRTTQSWKQQITTNQNVQTAKASKPIFSTYVYQKNELFLTFDVQYQLTIYTKGVKSTQKDSMTVLLKRVTSDSTTSGVGWQVSDWRDNGISQ